ncbi:MAG: periplasmic heavy metal sensor [Acidobacteria bacterium]|nr:periplasmic heavy metal sensor [Acidobacteriota bacterium]
MKTTWLAGLLMALTLVAGGAEAQMSRSFFPWWEMPFTRDLNLNDTQRQQIREILRENRSKMIDLRASLEKAEGEVEDLFEDSNVDQKRAAEVVERMVSARDNMTRHFTVMSLQMRRLLTNEQWKDLQSRRNRFENMRRPGEAGRQGAPSPGRPNFTRPQGGTAPQPGAAPQNP